MKIAHFSAGASSAVATILSKADYVVYADTGSEHPDNKRFIADVEKYIGKEVKIFKSDKYKDTWEVWEDRKYLANGYGAPCTKALKLEVLEPVEQIPNTIHIFGYNSGEIHRLDKLRRMKPDLAIECPLIDKGISSSGARQFLLDIGIQPPITYDIGLPHANCIPCPKASSPHYWALIRKEFPEQFNKMAELEDRLNARLTRIKGERIKLKDLPVDIKPSGAEAPSCDLLCEIAKQSI